MILIGTDEGIYRWVDGLGWPTFHALQHRSIVGLASPGRGTLVALERSGTLLESANNGLDWRTVPLPEGVERPTAMTALEGPAAILIGARPFSFYVREFGAVTPRPAPAPGDWRGRAQGLASTATALLGSPRTRKAPTAEAVKLAGWSPVGAPNAPNTAVAPLARSVVVAGPVWLASLNNAGLWRSENQGQSWTNCPGLPAEVHAVRSVDGKPEELWAATADGAYFSADAGKTWEDRSGGLDDARQVRAIAVHPTNPKNLLAGAAPAPAGDASPTDGLNHSLFETTDAGKTWAKVIKRNFPESLGYDAISDILFDPTAPENVMAALASGELWLTSNGGAYWGPIARQIRAARVLCPIG